MPVNEQHLAFACATAESNWIAWRADFEFCGQPKNLPVLARVDRYHMFLAEYRPLNRVENEVADKIRRELLRGGALADLIGDATGGGIDRRAGALSHHFKRNQRQISFLSKLATFAKPETFVAWDTYARKGVARLRREAGVRGTLTTYKDYLAAVNAQWHGDPGKELRRHIKSRPDLRNYPQPAFARRVLDVYLMLQGGRYPQVLPPEPSRRRPHKAPPTSPTPSKSHNP